MALDRFTLKQRNDVKFYKLLGCGHGNSFLPNDADPQRWGLLLCIDEGSIADFDKSGLVERWRAHSDREFRAVLNPISSHGQWSGQAPFKVEGNPSDSVGVVAITRARISWRKYLKFLRAIPSVSADLKNAPGLLASFGIGEAPIGLQGTFSYWQTSEALRDFAFRGDAHVRAISGTHEYKWYSEELFARFAVREIRGEL